MQIETASSGLINNKKHTVILRVLAPVVFFTILLAFILGNSGCTQSKAPAGLEGIERYQITDIEHHIAGNEKYIDGDLTRAVESWNQVEQILKGYAAENIDTTNDEIEQVNKLLGQVAISDNYDRMKEVERAVEEAYFINRSREDIITKLDMIREKLSNLVRLTEEQNKVIAAYEEIRASYYGLSSKLKENSFIRFKASDVTRQLDLVYGEIDSQAKVIRGVSAAQKDRFFSDYQFAAEKVADYARRFGSLLTRAVSLYSAGESRHDVKSLKESVEQFQQADAFYRKTTNNDNCPFCQDLIARAETRIKEIEKWAEYVATLIAELKPYYDSGVKNFGNLRFSAAEREFRTIQKKLSEAPREAGVTHYEDSEELLTQSVSNTELFEQGNDCIQTWKLGEAQRLFKTIRQSDDRLNPEKSKRMKFYLDLSSALKRKYADAKRYYRNGEIDKAYGNISYVMQYATRFKEGLSLQEKVGALYKHIELLRSDYANCRFKNLDKHFQEGKTRFPAFRWPVKINDFVAKGGKIGPLWKDAEMKIDSGFYVFAVPLLEKCLKIDPGHEKIRSTLSKIRKKL